LFHRDFMEYHQDSFEDFSLLIFNQEKLVAVLPANKIRNKIFSHQGLTYGGFVFSNKVAFQTVLGSVMSLLKYLSENNIQAIVLKQLPKIYHLRPSDEMDYLLFILKAKLVRKNLSMTIPLNNTMNYSKLRTRKIKMALSSDLRIIIDEDFSSFWNEVLIPNLRNKYGVKPVHSLSEINYLHEKFPNKIKQYNVYMNGEILAGCTVFETKKVAHLQYISTKKDKNVGALDFLINELIYEVYKDKEYFDFGISNENEGKNINLGLLNWKQSFGASPVIHDFYEIQVENYPALKNILI